MASLNELKEVLREQLEETGVLNEVRCRLRAEIFRALNDTAPPPPKPIPENALVNELVREYMQFNNYNHSLSVFTAEANAPSEQVPREVITQQLRVQEDGQTRQLPLLYALVLGSKKPAAPQAGGYKAIFSPDA